MHIIEKLLDLIKTALDKYLIASSIAIVISISIYMLTHNNLSTLSNLDKLLYVVLLFFSSFILILFLEYIWNMIAQHKRKIESIKNKNEEIKNELLNIVDSMNPASRKMLDYFLEHNNTQIVIPSCIEIPYSIQPFCIKNDFQVDHKIYPFNPMNMEQVDWVLNPGVHAIKIKLENSFYQQLKWLRKHNGAISSFN